MESQTLSKFYKYYSFKSANSVILSLLRVGSALGRRHSRQVHFLLLSEAASFLLAVFLSFLKESICVGLIDFFGLLIDGPLHSLVGLDLLAQQPGLFPKQLVLLIVDVKDQLLALSLLPRGLDPELIAFW
jgi:hypothetical protein